MYWGTFWEVAQPADSEEKVDTPDAEVIGRKLAIGSSFSCVFIWLLDEEHVSDVLEHPFDDVPLASSAVEVLSRSPFAGSSSSATSSEKKMCELGFMLPAADSSVVTSLLLQSPLEA